MIKGESGGAQTVLVVIALAGALLAPHVSSSTVPSGAEGAPSRNGEQRALEVEVGDGVVRVTAKESVLGAAAQTRKLLEGLFNARGEDTPSVGLSDTLGPASKQEPASSEIPATPHIGRRPPRKVVPLIVSVPDPRQSQMALYYDQMLVVLRQALAAHGYVQGEFALPWQREPVSKASNRKEAGSWSPDDAVPGFILFSNDPKDGEAEQELLAILTTESPVTGASVPQLNIALQIATALGSERVPIVAPFFSGSSESWVKALRSFPSAEFNVATGSATGAIDDSFAPVARFERTVPRDHVLVAQISRILQRFDPTHQRSGAGERSERPVAKLIEVGTGYGRYAVGDDENRQAQSASALTTHSFSFPIHISDVRAEREKALSTQPTPLLGLRRTLGLKFDTSREREPDVPATLSYLTAFADDLTLGQQLLGICEQRYRFLVLQATDPIDVIYLAQEARKYCPELTPVILGYNELFTHPDLGSTLSGALVVAPYPPSFRIALTRDDPQRHAFPSAVSQGFYNAVLRALGDRDELLGLTCDASARCRCDVYVSQLAGAQPWPLLSHRWETSAREQQARGTQPVAQREPPPAADLSVGSASMAPRIDAKTTSQARLVAWPVLFVAVFHLVARRFRRGMVTSDNEAWKAARSFRVVVADLSLFVMVLLSCLPFIVITWDQGTQIVERPTLMIISLVAAVALVWLLLEAGRSALSLRFEERWSWGTKLASTLTLLGTGVLLVTLGCWLWSLERTPSDGANPLDFVVQRLLDPFRMSPATPLIYIAAGVYVWALFALRRIARLARFPAKPPCDEKVVAVSPVSEAINSLWKELCAPWSQPRYVVLIGSLLLFVVWRFLMRVRPSFEGAPYDRAFWMGCIILGLFIAGEAIRFLSLSSLLIDLLRELASQPMVDAYNRISRRVSGSFGLQLDARVPAPHELKISALTCRSLANLAGAPVPVQELDLAGAAATVEERMKALVRPPYAATAEEAAHAALFDAAGRVHEGLEAIWRDRAEGPDVKLAGSDLDVVELLPGGKHENAPTPLLLMAAMPRERYIWTRMAEDFVALRISTFIYQVLHELRHTLTFVLLGALLLVASVTSYPFQPAHFLRLCAWSVVVLVVIMALTRMLALERNEILSRLGGTRPDRIEWNAAFVQQLAIYVVLPLVAAVIGLFPGLGDALATQLSTLSRILPPST